MGKPWCTPICVPPILLNKYKNKLLDQIDYNRWVHIFTYQYPWRCFIIATN
jgi:hypothetical protein